jgi:hypothetical protein
VCIHGRGDVFTEPLPRNDKGFTYRHTGSREGFMKYAIEMGSGVMIYIPGFIKIGSAIQKLIVGGYTDTHRYTVTQQQGDLISLLLYFQKKENRLKRVLKYKPKGWGDIARFRLREVNQIRNLFPGRIRWR